MTTKDRIDDLLVRKELGFLRDFKKDIHTILNYVDSAIGADTEWLSSLECRCLWHIGKVCSNRRAVGARVRMLEEILALSDLRQQFAA